MNLKTNDRVQNKSTRQIGVVLEVGEDMCLVELSDKDRVYWEIRDVKPRRLMILDVAEAT